MGGLVGRVRGGNGSINNGKSGETANKYHLLNRSDGTSKTGIVGGGLSGPSKNPAKRSERREAILNKSLGLRAQQQRQCHDNLSSSSSPKGKLSQLRKESRVAATWSKGSQGAVKKISHTSSTFSSFGASVARAGGLPGVSMCSGVAASGTANVGKGMDKIQIKVNLQNGKQMKLPPSSIGGLGKTVGVFSSLQQKMTKSEKDSSSMPKKGSGSKKR